MTAPDDFEVPQGTWFSREWEARVRNTDGSTGAVIPLHGWAARMQMRRSKRNPELLGDFSSDDGTLEVQPDGEVGVVRWTAGADVTVGWTFRSCRYDVILFDPTDPTIVVRLVEGTITLDRSVTRAS